MWVFSSLQTLMEDGKYVSMVHSPFSTILRAFAQRIKAAIMRCGCTWPSSTITVTTNREKGMSNGFSSRKDLLLTSPARKEAKQVRTKANVRFRPKRQATVRYRHNRPYVQHGSHETIPGAHDRGSPRFSFYDGLGICVRLSCRECVPILCIVSCFVHIAQHIALMAHVCQKKKREKISSQGSQGTLPSCVGGVRDRRGRLERVPGPHEAAHTRQCWGNTCVVMRDH